MEPHKRPASRSPPAWHRQSHPPRPASTADASHLPPPSQHDALKSDASIHAIPAPAYIDLGVVKPDKDAAEARQQQPVPESTSTPAPSLTSSANMYLGPPPPYSSHHPSQPLTASSTAAASQNGQPAPSSPPMSRRESRDDTAPELPRQSLPSISEALKLPGLYTQQSQPSSMPHPPPFPQAAGIADAAHSVSSSSPSLSRSHIDSHHASSLSSYSSQPSPHHTKPPDLIGHRPYTTVYTESPRPSYGQPYTPQGPSPTDAQPPRRASPGPHNPYNGPPSQHYSTSSLPPLSATSNPSWPAFTSSAGPPPAVFSQPPPGHYPPKPPPHQPDARPVYAPSSGYSFPPPSTSGLTYQQSLSSGAAQQAYAANAEIEKVEEQRRAAAALHAKRGGSFHGAGYGMTVKRHLDDFDLENSLNEIAERTQQVLEFSRDYGREAHKYSRSAMPISQLPATNKITDMINQSLAITDALHRLKSTVDGMNIAAAAAEEQARQQQQQGTNKPGMYAAYGPEGQGHPGYGIPNGQEKLGDKGEMGPGGGFAGGDSKKRRGRNAPPGRCHSCNRAETPEWRRGPDGARTLCNACGLHYAKLTRKMGGAKTGQPGGSNLRPKDGEDTTS